MSSLILVKFPRNEIILMNQVLLNSIEELSEFSFLQLGQIQVFSFFFTEFIQLSQTAISQMQ